MRGVTEGEGGEGERKTRRGKNYHISREFLGKASIGLFVNVCRK